MKFSSILFFILFILSSCTVTITSNKSSDYKKQAKSIYVLLRGANTSGEYLGLLKKDLKTILTEKGIVSDYYIFEPLSLETNEQVFERVNKTNPDIILIINQTETRFHNGTNDGVTFDLQIFPLNSKNMVWRGNIEAGGLFDINALAMRSAKQIVKKLIEDKILYIQIKSE